MKPGANLEALVHQRIQENLELKQALLRDPAFQQRVAEVGGVLTRIVREGRKVLFFGNGGSAADAQHLAAELAGKLYLDRGGLPGLALTVNTSSLTAIGNDYSFDLVFARQVESLGVRGDAAFAISTSGKSPNVLRAAQAAKDKGLVTIGLTGRSGGALKSAVDYCLCIPSDDPARIQEAHILIGHILCEIVERSLFSEPSGASHP